MKNSQWKQVSQNRRNDIIEETFKNVYDIITVLDRRVSALENTPLRKLSKKLHGRNIKKDQSR